MRLQARIKKLEEKYLPHIKENPLILFTNGKDRIEFGTEVRMKSPNQNFDDFLEAVKKEMFETKDISAVAIMPFPKAINTF